MEAAGVVVGIVVKGNKFLVERRRWNEKIDPGIVCLPAGHVKPNESLEDALEREMMEELDIKVKKTKFVCKNFYVASNGERQHAYCYLVTDYEGEPVCKAAQEIFWEKNINNMSLEVDRNTIRKMREIQEEQKIFSRSRLNVTHEEKPEMDHTNIAEKLAKTLKTTEVPDANAAVVVLLRAHEQDFQVLFVKRAETPTDTWSGQTALPGGKRNPEDLDLKETVIRETLEETSINLLEGCQFLGAMEPFRSIQRPEMKIVAFVVLQKKEQTIKLNEELSGYFWMPLKELAHNKGKFKSSLGEFPAYTAGNQVIWGLTYKIVHNLLSLLSTIEKGKTRED